MPQPTISAQGMTKAICITLSAWARLLKDAAGVGSGSPDVLSSGMGR